MRYCNNAVAWKERPAANEFRVQAEPLISQLSDISFCFFFNYTLTTTHKKMCIDLPFIDRFAVGIIVCLSPDNV